MAEVRTDRLPDAPTPGGGWSIPASGRPDTHRPNTRHQQSI